MPGHDGAPPIRDKCPTSELDDKSLLKAWAGWSIRDVTESVKEAEFTLAQRRRVLALMQERADGVSA